MIRLVSRVGVRQGVPGVGLEDEWPRPDKVSGGWRLVDIRAGRHFRRVLLGIRDFRGLARLVADDFCVDDCGRLRERERRNRLGVGNGLHGRYGAGGRNLVTVLANPLIRG